MRTIASVGVLTMVVVAMLACSTDTEEPAAPAAASEAQPAASQPGAAAEPGTAPAEPAAEQAPAAPPNSFLGKIRANSELSTFLELASSVGLDADLTTSHGVTLLVPNNAAFAGLPDLAALRADRPRLRNALANHFLVGTLRTSYLSGQQKVGTQSQSRPEYPIAAEGGVVSIGGAKLVQADESCDNGVLHVVDKVLVPESFDASQKVGRALWLLPQ